MNRGVGPTQPQREWKAPKWGAAALAGSPAGDSQSAESDERPKRHQMRPGRSSVATSLRIATERSALTEISFVLLFESAAHRETRHSHEEFRWLENSLSGLCSQTPASDSRRRSWTIGRQDKNCIS